MSSSGLMPVPEEMASKAPFPPKCPVYIHDDETHIRSRGVVQKIYIRMSSLMPEMFYDILIHSQDVQNSNTTRRCRGPQLRYQNGCNITVKLNEDCWPGLVLGTCDIPDNDERRAFTVRKFWYSVQLFSGLETMIEHEILPSAVSFRTEPYSPEEADDTEISSLGNGQEVAVAEQESRQLLVKDDPEQLGATVGNSHEEPSKENEVWVLETYIEDIRKEAVVDALFGSKSSASTRKNTLSDIPAKVDTEDVVLDNVFKGCMIEVWTLSEAKSRAATRTVLTLLEDTFSRFNTFEYSEYTKNIQKATSRVACESKQDTSIFGLLHSLGQQSNTNNSHVVDSEPNHPGDIQNTGTNTNQNNKKGFFRQIVVPLPESVLHGEIHFFIGYSL